MRLPVANRKLHRLVGVVFAASLAVTAVTGILWAFAPHLYWKPGYLERKHAAPAPAFERITVTVPQAVAIARTHLAARAIAQVAVRAELGRLRYEIQADTEQGKKTLLVDAESGQVASPLSPDDAVAVAREYVAGAPALSGVELVAFEPRKGGAPRPTYRVRFGATGDLEIFVDPDSGRVVEEQDRTRRFHFAVMRLHQLNYFGFHKTLTLVPGLALVLLIVSGLVMWWRSRRRRRATSAAVE